MKLRWTCLLLTSDSLPRWGVAVGSWWLHFWKLRMFMMNLELQKRFQQHLWSRSMWHKLKFLRCAWVSYILACAFIQGDMCVYIHLYIYIYLFIYKYKYVRVCVSIYMCMFLMHVLQLYPTFFRLTCVVVLPAHGGTQIGCASPVGEWEGQSSSRWSRHFFSFRIDLLACLALPSAMHSLWSFLGFACRFQWPNA